MRTIVIFRVFKNGGDVIALFPNEPVSWENPDQCSSYQRIGQHGGADYSHVVSSSRRAKPEEYASLKRELEQIGYNLNVKVKRMRHG